MYLKALSVKGFKSFPDRTRLEFGPGVSVIVGPNGSGKSNVTDAVLWALGEQSPLAVRGQSMQDIIFSGAPGRRAASGAEVELVLDDAEGRLGLGAEVSIVRRLDRSGEGEYRLGGARCRLVDVLEVLSDTGLGKEMHSVISQGRVEAIVTSKPRDRRMLIEEAAGLGKHRKRRRRAQLKLARTQENVDRALDIEREARSRLRPLKRQAEAAEQHERLARQLLEARWELSREDLRERNGAAESARFAAEQARASRVEVERQLRDVAQRREAAEEALAARTTQREELSRRLYAAQGAGERLRLREESVRGALGTVTARLRRTSQEAERLAEQSATESHDPEQADRIASLEAELHNLDLDRKAELARQLAELEAHLEQARLQTGEREAELERISGQRGQAEAALGEARSNVREAERQVEATRRQAAKVGGELAAVNQFLRSHARLPEGLRALADEVQVEPGYELAVAAVLDGRLQAALVDGVGGAHALLDRSGADGGLALVLADLPSGEGDEEAPPVDGAARLSDRVKGENGGARLARRLLERAWVVETLDGEAADAAGEDFRGLLVTRGGRVWNPAAHEVRQAPRAGAERILQERNRRDQLVAATEGAARAEVEARREVERATAQEEEVERAHDRAVEEHRQAVRARDEAGEQERRLSAQIARRRSAPDDGPAAARRAQIVAELSNARATMQRAEQERVQRLRRAEQLERLRAADAQTQPLLERLQAALAAVGEGIEAQRTSFAAALAADRQASEHVSAELRTCAQQEADLQGRLHQANENLTRAEVALQRAQDQRDEAQAALAELAARLELAPEPAEAPLDSEARAVLQTRVERLERRRELLGPVNPLAQEEYAAALEHVEELERQRADLETALRELRDLIADTDRQIQETFQETYDAAARNFEELAAQLFPGGRGRLRLVDDGATPASRTLGGEPAESAAGPEAEEGEDPEAPKPEDRVGVEIEITPAGKDMKRLTLLSGGEKSMTALAFLFSVFLAKPCPFYILDEVEAALDDLNIDRFLELLRQYSARAQFIVVTHQKRTMEAADSLYGVSMGGDGISKVISRRLPPVRAAPPVEAAA